MKRFYSPGRVNLIGEHIDYNGGNVLPIAINYGTYAKVTKRDDKLLKVISLNFKDVGEITIDLNKEMIKDDLWSDYVKAVIFVLRKHGYHISQGLNVEIEGNIPNGSGLSSSASLEVLFMYIFKYYNNLELSRENMAIYSKEAENDFVGVNCGIMDQFIIANAKDRNAMLLNCDTLAYSFVPLELNEYTLAVLNTNKKRGLVDSEYNSRRQECEDALVKLAQIYNIKHLCELKPSELEKYKSVLTINEYKRAKHAVTEQKRVEDCYNLLHKGNIVDFAAQLNESHTSLRDDFEVSCFELDSIVDIANELGSIGSRLTGAGFGGCAIAIIKTENKENFKNSLIKKYKEKTKLDAEVYFVETSGGVDEL